MQTEGTPDRVQSGEDIMLTRIIATVVAATAISGSLAAQDTINLRFAVFTPEQEITYQEAMRPWAEAVMEDTDGRVNISLYPGGILGRDGSQQIRMMREGVADIAFIIPAYNPGLFPDNLVIELPDTTASATEGSVAMWRLLEAGMLRGYEDFEVLGIFTTSPYSIHSRVPVQSMDDLRGQRIRVAGQLEQECIEAIGGVPVGMPIGSVPESLSRGVIDAVPMHFPALHAFGIASATPHHYNAFLGSLPFGFVMAREKFDALPEDVQQVMRARGGEELARLFGAAMDAENERLVVQTIDDPAQTVVDPTPQEQAAWSEAMASCIDSWVNEHDRGAELYNALLDEIAAIRAE